MDTRKLLVATAAVFVVYSGLAFVIHEVILAPEPVLALEDHAGDTGKSKT